MFSSNVLISHFDHVFLTRDRAKVKCGCPSSQKEMRAQGEIFAGLAKYRENVSNLLIHGQVLVRRNPRLQWQLENIPHQKFQSKSNIVLKALV